MRLATNWRAVLRYAWSVRLLAAAAVFSGAEVALPIIERAIDIPPGIFAGLSAITVGAAFVARLVAQQSVSGGNNGQ